ncbi:MAG TPA: YkvA family protein [Polyangiaceae bacterium]|nr:YkvA family protein [Polyangiaceae bacterium]
MATLEARCLDAFPDWLRSLADDARALASVLEGEGAGVLQRRSAAALNYLFKSLDLIPDGLEDLGFIDDAFVIRAAADAVRLEAESELALDPTGTLARLATEAELVQEFLDSEYGRLTKYVAGLEQGSARGRSVATILADENARAEFVREVQEWAESYVAPGFTRDQRNLVKLRAFLLAKLPA